MKLQKIIDFTCRLLTTVMVLMFYTLTIAVSYFYIRTMIISTTLPFPFLWVAIYVVFLFNTIFNYHMASAVKPGSPSDFLRDELKHIRKYCRTCKIRQPPRTHHCSFCKKCILQMDHHCPWLGNCVGHHNRGYFLSFLLYLTALMSELLYVSIKENLTGEQVYMYVFVASLLCSVGSFAVFHWYLAMKGKTSLEFCETDDQYQPSPSIKQNLEIIFGTSNMIMILMPSLKILRSKGNMWESSN